MTTSGSFNFNLTRNEIITQALRTLGILADGEDATGDQISDGSYRLNLMIKAWRNKGISLPLYQEITVYLESGKQSYLIGATGDKAAARSYKTEVATAALSGVSTVTVDSASNFTNGDVVGVVQDNNTILWTTGTKSGNVITLGAALTYGVAVDNHVYFYTSIAQRPLTVKAARLKVNDGNETPVNIVNRQEYFNYTNKTATGKINSVYYDPQLNNGVLYTYLTADSVNDTLLLTVQRQVADFDSDGDTADFPPEWLEAIVYNLAVRMFTKYGIDADTKATVSAMADSLLQDAEDFDQEDSIQFSPSYED